MIPLKNFNRIALCLILFLTASTVTLTNATTEDNYKNDSNFLTNIYEATLTENGYKTHIIINPQTTGILTTENGYKLDFAIVTQGIGSTLEENGYKLDLIPEKTFPDIPDVAVTKIAASKTIVGEGYSTIINITASNQALNYETFTVIIQANTTIIKTQTITLTTRGHTIITFAWTTTGIAKGNYTISATAQPIPGETNTADNTLTNGWILVTILGDINGDRRCDMKDIVAMILAFGAKQGTGGQYWHIPPCSLCPHSPTIDANCDGKIDMKDIVIAILNYGQKW